MVRNNYAKMINIIKDTLFSILSIKDVFENEAQVRDAFVAQLRNNQNNYLIKVEVHFKKIELLSIRYLCFDIVLKDSTNNDIIPIELKYCKCGGKNTNFIDKEYEITNNLNKRRKGFLKDIKRIEDYIKNEPRAQRGYAIFLTHNGNGKIKSCDISEYTYGDRGDYEYLVKEIK